MPHFLKDVSIQGSLTADKVNDIIGFGTNSNNIAGFGPASVGVLSYAARIDHVHPDSAVRAVTHGAANLNVTNITGGISSSSNGLTINLSAANPQTFGISAGNGSFSLQTMTFANSNGVSFSTGTQGVFASVKTDYLTTAAQTNHSHGNPTLNLTNLSGTTASNSNGLTINLSANAKDGYNILAAGTQTAVSEGTIQFANSNGISFGMSGSSQITASYTVPNVPAQTIQTQNSIQVLGSSGNISFANGNGITFGGNLSTITASHNGLTTARASNDGIGLNTAGTNVTWTVNSGGISLNAGGYLTTAMQSQVSSNYMSTSERDNYFYTSNKTFANSTHSHGNPVLNLTNLNGTTASGSNGLTLSLSAVVPTQTVQPVAISGSNGSFNFNTLSLGNSNGMSFYSTNGSIVGSYTVPTIPNATVFSNSNNVSFGLNGSTVTATATFNQTVQTQNSVQVLGSSGNVSFANSNGITFGGNLSTITASHNGLTTAAQTNHSHGVTLNLTNLNGTTGGNSNGINLSLSAIIPSQTVQTQNVHNITLSGNSTSSGASGYSPISSGTLTLLGGNNITLQQDGNRLIISGPNVAGAQTGISGISAGTTYMSSGTLSIANGSGVSFGMNGNTLTASVRTDYAASNVTTNNIATANSSLFQHTSATSAITSNAMNTGERNNYFYSSNNTFADVAHIHGNPTLALTNINGTTASASNGVTFSLSAIVPAQSVQTQGSVQILGSSGNVSFANGNGITFGGNLNTITASHNGLTTARASNDGIGLNTAATGVTWTVNSGGISLNAGAYLTTALQSQMSSNYMSTTERANYFGTAAYTFANSTHSHGALALTNINATSASSGLSLSVPAQTVQPVAISGSNGSFAFSTVSLGNSNGLNFYTTNGSIVGSYTVPNVPAQTVQTQNSVQVLGSSGNISFANGNGITFGANASTITASHNALTTAAQTNHSHGVTVNATNLNFTTGGNSNGISLSLSAIVPSQTVQPVGSFGVSTGGNTLGTTGTVTNQFILAGGNNITLSQATGPGGNTVTISGPSLAAYLTTALQSQMSSNYMSTAERNNYFYTSNNTFANSTHLHGNPTLNLTNLNGTTASNSNGLTLSLSAIVPAQTVQTQNSVQVLGSSGNISFANGNGITFGANASTITASHNGLTTARASNDGVGLNTAATNVTWTINSAGLSLNAGAYLTTAMLSAMSSAYMSTSERNNYFGTAGYTFAHNTHTHGIPVLNLTNISGTTASNSNGLTLSLSAAAPGAGGGAGISAGTQSVSTGTIVFANSNGVTFGMSGSSQITASVQAGAGAGIGAVNNSNTTYTSGTIQLTEGGGAITIASGTGQRFAFSVPATSSISGINLTITPNGNTLSFSAAAPGAVTNHSHGNPTLNLTNLSGTTASNSNGLTVSLSAAPGAAIDHSHGNPVLNLTNIAGTTASNSNGLTLSLSAALGAATNHSHGNPVLNLTNISGTTASNSNGLTLSLSAAAPGAGGGVGLSAGTQSVNTGTIVFANSNGVTFGMSGSSQITASVQAGAGGGIGAINNSNTTYTSGTIQITEGGGAITIASGTGQRFAFSVPATSSISGINLTITPNGNTLSFSAAAPGAASDHSHGNPTLALTNLSGTTASASNGMTISLSAAAPGGGAVLNRNMIEIVQGERMTTILNMSASQFSRRPIFIPFWMDGQNLCPKTVRMIVSGVGSSNRSLVATFGVALYSKANDTQLTLFSSDSQALSYTASSQSTVWNGIKIMDFTRMSNVTMTQEGRWVLATSFSASSHNATYANVLLYGADNMPAIGGFIVGGTTTATNAASAIFPFWGVYSTTTAGFPNTVGMTQIQGGNSASLIDPYCIIKEV